MQTTIHKTFKTQKMGSEFAECFAKKHGLHLTLGGGNRALYKGSGIILTLDFLYIYLQADIEYDKLDRMINECYES